MKEDDYAKASQVIDAIALISRVSRQACFRFAYFGKRDELRDNVRFLIQERILFSEGAPLDAEKIEELVDKFLNEVALPNISDEQISQAWGEQSRLIFTLTG